MSRIYFTSVLIQDVMHWRFVPTDEQANKDLEDITSRYDAILDGPIFYREDGQVVAHPRVAVLIAERLRGRGHEVSDKLPPGLFDSLPRILVG